VPLRLECLPPVVHEELEMSCRERALIDEILKDGWQKLGSMDVRMKELGKARETLEVQSIERAEAGNLLDWCAQNGIGNKAAVPAECTADGVRSPTVQQEDERVSQLKTQLLRLAEETHEAQQDLEAAKASKLSAERKLQEEKGRSSALKDEMEAFMASTLANYRLRHVLQTAAEVKKEKQREKDALREQLAALKNTLSQQKGLAAIPAPGEPWLHVSRLSKTKTDVPIVNLLTQPQYFKMTPRETDSPEKALKRESGASVDWECRSVEKGAKEPPLEVGAASESSAPLQSTEVQSSQLSTEREIGFSEADFFQLPEFKQQLALAVVELRVYQNNLHDGKPTHKARCLWEEIRHGESRYWKGVVTEADSVAEAEQAFRETMSTAGDAFQPEVLCRAMARAIHRFRAVDEEHFQEQWLQGIVKRASRLSHKPFGFLKNGSLGKPEEDDECSKVFQRARLAMELPPRKFLELNQMRCPKQPPSSRTVPEGSARASAASELPSTEPPASARAPISSRLESEAIRERSEEQVTKLQQEIMQLKASSEARFDTLMAEKDALQNELSKRKEEECKQQIPSDSVLNEHSALAQSNDELRSENAQLRFQIDTFVNRPAQERFQELSPKRGGGLLTFGSADSFREEEGASILSSVEPTPRHGLSSSSFPTPRDSGPLPVHQLPRSQGRPLNVPSLHMDAVVGGDSQGMTKFVAASPTQRAAEEAERKAKEAERREAEDAERQRAAEEMSKKEEQSMEDLTDVLCEKMNAQVQFIKNSILQAQGGSGRRASNHFFTVFRRHEEATVEVTPADASAMSLGCEPGATVVVVALLGGNSQPSSAIVRRQDGSYRTVPARVLRMEAHHITTVLTSDEVNRMKDSLKAKVKSIQSSSDIARLTKQPAQARRVGSEPLGQSSSQTFPYLKFFLSEGLHAETRDLFVALQVTV